MRISIGVSRRGVLFGARAWSVCEKDCRASEEEGTRRDECGRVAESSSFSAALTGSIVHGTFWEATMELGSHGVIAT
jgi:hypothetical protein